MAPSNGWLIVQRELTGSVQVTDAPSVWATAVFSTPGRQIVGSNVAGAAHDSLVGAVRQATHEPLVGSPRARPALVLASRELVEEVRAVLGEEGVRAGVDAVVPPDWAEDILAELAGHLAGRKHADDPPAPEEWALLHQQAAAYARARPWDRRADDLHLRLELRIGSERADAIAIVLGNAGMTRGLAVCPGRVVPEAILMGGAGVPPPEGTMHFSLIARDETPPEMLERSARYGWPADLDAPLFVAMGPDGPQEIGRTQAPILTIALAAAVEHDRQGAGLGMTVRGQLLLATGRRGRYAARLEPNVPLDVPPGLRVMSGAVRDDLLPEGAVVGLGGLPWEELAWVRSRAGYHLAAPLERSPEGDALPILIIGLDDAEGERVASRLHAAHPDGMALVEFRVNVLGVIVTDTGMYGAVDMLAGHPSVAQFRRRLAATDGWHGILVASPGGGRDDPIHGFFECVLAAPPGRSGDQRSRRRTRRRGR